MNKKGWLTLLLGLCCLLAGALHIQLEPIHRQDLRSAAQLDSLITQTTYDFRIPGKHIDVRETVIDSVFSRKIYTITVPPGFSKTTFHHHLNKRIHPLGVTSYGTVGFPGHDLELRIIYNNTVHRSIYIYSDESLAYENPVIPKLPAN